MAPHTPAPTLREELNALAARQAQTDVQIADICRDIKQIRCDTREVVEMFRALSGGVKVLLLLGKVAAAVTAVVGAFAFFKNGGIK